MSETYSGFPDSGSLVGGMIVVVDVAMLVVVVVGVDFRCWPLRC